MNCPLCHGLIQPRDDYTVRVCCQVRYHAGCIHRRYVSGPRACPKCGKEPSLPFDEAPGAVPSRVSSADESISLVKRIFGSLNYVADSQTSERDVRELLDSGMTWHSMRVAGATKEWLMDHGLDLALAKQHASVLKLEFGFDHADWKKLQ